MQGFKKKMKIKNFKLDLESIEANDDSANGFDLFCFVDCVLKPTCSCDLFDWEIDLTEFEGSLFVIILIQVFDPSFFFFFFGSQSK